MERSYNKLWKMLIDHNMTKTDLRMAAKLSTNVIAKLGKNESVPLETLEKICSTLNCSIDDVVEYPKKEAK